MTYDELLTLSPYGVNEVDKEKILGAMLIKLTKHHQKSCEPYARILKAFGYDKFTDLKIANVPFLPVRLFKELNLKSIADENIFKTMTSSGTSGQQVSKIFLDKETAARQQKTLVHIVEDFIGAKRMPLIIIDTPSVLKKRQMFSARGAGILGFSIFGRPRIYALNENMELELEKVCSFIEKYNGNVLLFGFTFMVWQHFYKVLKAQNRRLNLENAVLIHGGGWKKLASEAVSSKEFRKCLKDIAAINRVHNYYGMVEQTGCIYMECEAGHLHASTYSEIIVRRANDFSVADIGEKGIIEVLSPMANSYPGHSLLTEDEGIILGIDDCPCGRKGKYFKVLGRLKAAELRGCSDTYAANF